MKNKFLKLTVTIFASILVWFCIYITSKAASFSASISKTTVNVGDTVTVTVTADNAAGMYAVSASNSNVSLSSGSESEFLEDGSTTVTYKAIKAGTVTITATASDMTDLDKDSNQVTGSKTFTVTIKEKSSSGDSKPSGGDDEGDDKPNTPSMSFTSTNKTMYATDSLNVRESYTTNSDVIGSLSVGQSVTVTGIGDGWTRISYGGQTAYVISSGLTSEKPKDESEEVKDNPDEKEQDEKDKKNEEEDKDKSNVKALRSLTVEQYKLEPKFAPDITEYAVTVGGDVEKLNIEAMAEDENSTIEILGNSGLLIGENTINIKVTAEDGTVRTYTINVTKVVDVGVQLSELSVENYTLTPEFSSDVYEYTLNIGDTSITSLNINAKSDKENVSIEIAGNTELKPGKNIITILVTSNDDNLTTTYQIVVNIDEAYKQNTQIIAGIDDKDLFMYIGIGAAVLIVLIIIIAVIIKKHRKNEDGDEDFSPLDNYNEDTLNNDKTSMDISNKSEDSEIHKSIESNNEIVNNDEQEKDKKRKEKLEEFSSYASSSDSDANTTTRKRGKHF